MSYQSPIEVFQTQMQFMIEEEICKAVMNVGVDVDKNELMKALRYDREQYQKGFKDRDDQIVRCKDCKYRFIDGDNVCFNMCLLNHNKVQQDDWFCADGEREKT